VPQIVLGEGGRVWTTGGIVVDHCE
jgi:hypothetical protein